jgi:hypothetical protein
LLLSFGFRVEQCGVDRGKAEEPRAQAAARHVVAGFNSPLARRGRAASASPASRSRRSRFVGALAVSSPPEPPGCSFLSDEAGEGRRCYRLHRHLRRLQLPASPSWTRLTTDGVRPAIILLRCNSAVSVSSPAPPDPDGGCPLIGLREWLLLQALAARWPISAP